MKKIKNHKFQCPVCGYWTMVGGNPPTCDRCYLDRQKPEVGYGKAFNEGK